VRRLRCASTGDREGQATVEAALAFPVVLLAILLVVQGGVVVRDALTLGLAAREGARAAAVTASDDAVSEAVVRSAGSLDADRIEIAVFPPEDERRRGEPVTVRLRYVVRLRMPVVDRIVTTELPLGAEATMRLERAGPTPVPSPTPTPGPTPSPTLVPDPTPSPEPDPP
jgi:hypothetical protein